MLQSHLECALLSFDTSKVRHNVDEWKMRSNTLGHTGSIRFFHIAKSAGDQCKQSHNLYLQVGSISTVKVLLSFGDVTLPMSSPSKDQIEQGNRLHPWNCGSDFIAER